MKILTIIGARPQFIKAAPLSIEFRNKGIQEITIHTGQHYDSSMSDIFFEELNISKPDFKLNIGGYSHGEGTGRMIIEIEKILLDQNPNAVVVFGDTNSTLSGSLAAVKLNIPVFHVESGLRSFNKKMPEEINRICVDHISKLLFTPSLRSKNQLISEGIKNNIHVVGDIMHDSLLLVKDNLKKIEGDFYLATIHRQENVDNIEKLSEIIIQLKSLANRSRVVLPIHPRTKNKLDKFSIDVGSIEVIEPLGYIDFLSYLSSCKCLITDSGGAQKDAYYLKKNVLILRKETEWIELVENEYNMLWDKQLGIENQLLQLQRKKTSFSNSEIYGSGDTSKFIVNHIITWYENSSNNLSA